MMRQYELVERVQRYNPDTDEDLLNKAYVYGMTKHGHQKRASGDPYFSHPLEVAAILTDMKLDDATIAVALLHDTIEDTDATRAEIDALFGETIGGLVEGLTKIDRLDLVSREVAQAENLRKLLLAIADDVRVLLVKLADRLHNMRTLGFVKDEKKKRIARETMDIYAPLAGRMGMQDMRDELEELSFQILNPDAYEAIVGRLKDFREKTLPSIEKIEHELVTACEAANLQVRVSSREKRPYSIFRKMETKGVAFEQLPDIYGFRLIVDTVDNCYRALGIIHRKWSIVPGRFKDFISNPKQNDYKSIHTTVIGPARQRVELQIRTEEMHQIAEYGVAAHTLYKDAKFDADSLAEKQAKGDSRSYAWLRSTIEILDQSQEVGEAALLEFLENTKLELFQDQVFCFTPKGRLIALPRGANSIYFAYAVHTDVGNTCIGTKINGRVMPLLTELANGDEVSILRSEAQTPPAAWEHVVVTGRARAAIRRASRQRERNHSRVLGGQIISRLAEAHSNVFDDDTLKKLPDSFEKESEDEFIIAVGSGEITSKQILGLLNVDKTDLPNSVEPAPEPKEQGWFRIGIEGLRFRVPGLSGTRRGGVPLADAGAPEDVSVQFAEGGRPVPGDRVVGILEAGKGITIYPIESESLLAFENQPEQWLDVRWDNTQNPDATYPATLELSIVHEAGTLAPIVQTLAASGTNIESLNVETNESELARIQLVLLVKDVKHLHKIMLEINNLSAVYEVARKIG